LNYTRIENSQGQVRSVSQLAVCPARA
jgi:hypothetical protein